MTTPAAPGADAMDDEALIARLQEPSTLQVYCHQAADRLLSLREENARRDWQPIETAPKDGTRILAGRFTGSKKADREGRVDVTWWRQPKDNAGYIGWGEFNSTHWPPTHWMPIPEPPRAALTPPQRKE